MSRIPKFIKVGGLVAQRDYRAEHCGVVGTKKTHCRPNMALGVHPRQIPELQRLLKRRGVRATQFDQRTGDCLVEDRSHVNDICKARGMRNQDGGYGDFCGV
jgi:hypothetical protein